MPERTLLDRVRRIALALPDTEESTRLGGSPHFYHNGKIFAGCGEEDGVWSFGVKVGLDLQSLMVTRPGIHVARYVGRYGWISVEERALTEPGELEELIVLSYDLISGGAAKTKNVGSKTASKKSAPKQAVPKDAVPKRASGAMATNKKTAAKRSARN